MNPGDWDRCKQLFCDALELTAEARILLLERECGDNSELRAEIARMLDAATDDASLLDVAAAEHVVGTMARGEPFIVGDIVGRYRVLRNVGQGGTSLVYLAEHAGLKSPRRFAIKVIASAFVSGQRDKFDRECDILAAFEHPHIARIVDKGVTETGWPYLVMDYIDGLPINKYCVENDLAPPEIVRLILDCCEAVQYIHGNRVLHCDLKPSNILVDAGGSPRILDFGIARLIEPRRDTRSGQTTRGIRPLTPDYASPEQLMGAPLTRATDVYSLGVVLYECLARTLPYEHSDYAWPQIGKRIAETEPAPPSKARLKTASSREDILIARQLRGDLDSIVFKALAPSPEKRYKSMDELSGDLNRYLAGEPVQARRSGWTDRAAKHLKRRKRVVAEIAAIVVSIGMAIGISTWYSGRRQVDREARYLENLKALVDPLILASAEELPGPSRERAAIAAQVTATIESLTPKISQYPELVPDLGYALLRTADMLGNPYGVNLGREEAARAYYRRAGELVRGRTSAAAIEIRAKACLGLGDTYSHPAVDRDPAQAAEWYRRALGEISTKNSALRSTAALAHSRLGMLAELLGDAADARAQYDEALRSISSGMESKAPLEIARNRLWRAGMEAPEVRATSYREAVGMLDQMVDADGRGILRNSGARPASIEAHLALGAGEVQLGRAAEAEKEFAVSEEMAEHGLISDPEDLQERRELAIALARRASSLAAAGDSSAAWIEATVLRERATEVLRSTMRVPDSAVPGEHAGSACPESVERPVEGGPPGALRAGDLLIANRRTARVAGTLLVYSPGSLEMSVVAAGGYLSDIADVAVASRTEIYMADRSLTASGGIVRLRLQGGRWLQRPVSCGGLLRRPTALTYNQGHLVLVDPDADSVRLIEIDLETGGQTLLGRTGTFDEPGKIAHGAAGVYYLSLFWPGEGGPAEIVAFQARTGKFASESRYGLLENPVALAVTPKGELIAADREWTGFGGAGDIIRIGVGGVGRLGRQTIISRRPEVSRVTAIAVASEREAWYTTAGVPYSSGQQAAAQLFQLDLVSGNATAVTISDKILTAPGALVRVE